MQSGALVAIGVPALLWIEWRAVQYGRLGGHSGSIYLLEASAVSIFFALAVLWLRAATPAAALCGALICFDITVLTGRPGGSVARSGLTPLALLFAITYASTRFRRDLKRSEGEREEQRRGRNAAQVMANLGIAAIAAVVWHRGLRQSALLPHVFASMQAPALAALAEATADTVSSEIGRAVGGRPLLLTSWRHVAVGEDGAVSLAGTVAGLAAAGVISLAGWPTMDLHGTDVARVWAAGAAGFFFDSLLGATLERRGWIGNNLVNFASTVFAAGLCRVLA